MKFVITLVFIYVLTGCNSNDPDLGFHTDNKQLMEALKSELEKRKLPFDMTADGYLMYSSEDKVEFEEVKRTLYQRMNKMSNLFKEDEARIFFINLLESNGVKYHEEQKSDGVWVVWYPQNKSQQLEFSQAVAEYIFKLRAKTNE